MDRPNLSHFDGNSIDGLQFCAQAYELFEAIRRAEDGRSRLRMRASPIEKKLVEELLPICRYVQAKYRLGRYIAVKWIDGNQQFDAEFNQAGARVDLGYEPAAGHLEVTCAMHQNDYLARELIEKGKPVFGVEGLRREKGTKKIESEPVVHANNDFIDTFCALVLAQIAKKAGIAYPADTTLVVKCLLNSAYMPAEWGMLMDKVGAGLPEHSFREIFLFDANSDYACSFYGKPAEAAAS